MVKTSLQKLILKIILYINYGLTQYILLRFTARIVFKN